MASDKKKFIYGIREEQLINGNDLQDKAAILALFSDLSLRVRVCECEILRLQNVIYSIEEEESLRKLKKRYQTMRNTGKVPANDLPDKH